jgi:Amt family ammonium transporter
MNAADTAWILTSTALVLFMTLPGLALFYGGLVRASNVLSVLTQCFAIACLASVLWLICVYSLAFAPGWPIIGSLDKAFLMGVGRETLFPGSTLPETVFFMFQMTFAIITPALIVGAFVERMKFMAVLVFSGAWLIFVYAPVAHWVWGGGWLAEMGVMDFAGGLVVHLTAGVSALVVVTLLGSRSGFPKDVKPPHAPWMTMAGASMLWVGWFGFNAGSALASGGSAGMAMLVTHISAATASLVWMVIEWRKFGKPSLIGIVTGTIAGLATITPASGFVGPIGGLIIGFVGGSVCYVLVGVIKQTLKLDDSLDVFAVHGAGGLTGVLLTAFFVQSSLGGAGLPEGQSAIGQLGVQCVGVLATGIWSLVGSYVILKILQSTMGLRVSDDEEAQGLDISAHGESGYSL